METIIIEFEQVTKYPLIQFLSKYRDFLLNSYPEIDRFFSGKTEGIDNKHLVLLSELTRECKDVLDQFENFSNKFSSCGYWELLEYIGGLNDILEQTNKLPKFRRTTLTKRGYKPMIQATSEVGGMRTIDDVAYSIKNINSENSNWIELMLNNDMNESDWEIDSLKSIDVFINNTTDVVVTTVLDSPVGERVYGRDISRKISFSDNDLVITEYEQNVEQKCDILMNLTRGDVPENMLFGKNPAFLGGNIKQFSYPEIARDIRNNFMQNDMFESVSISSFNFEGGSMTMTVDVKTKYDYRTQKEVII